jgi:hypothetical protein
MHLPAAGLVQGKIYLMPQAFQQVYQGAARLWEQGVIKAGDKERDSHISSPFQGYLCGKMPTARLLVLNRSKICAA